MGYSVRTARYRYTEWRDWETGKTVARELYAHDEDPAETRNIAGTVEMKGVVAELSRRLPRSLRLGTNSGRLTPPLIRTSTN
jgi:iduronate 2-sulfatase